MFEHLREKVPPKPWVRRQVGEEEPESKVNHVRE